MSLTYVRIFNVRRFSVPSSPFTRPPALWTRRRQGVRHSLSSPPREKKSLGTRLNSTRLFLLLSACHTCGPILCYYLCFGKKTKSELWASQLQKKKKKFVFKTRIAAPSYKTRVFWKKKKTRKSVAYPENYRHVLPDWIPRINCRIHRTHTLPDGE